MNITQILDAVPLWGVFLLSLLVTFLSLEFGLLVGRRRQERLTGEGKVITGPVVAASFSLLAFMLAITYGAVDSRLRELKHVALDEVNAIGTTFLRADLLPEADRAEVRQLLQDYVDLRVEAVSGEREEEVAGAVAASEKLQGVLWSTAAAIAYRNPTPISALFVLSLNELIDAYGKRITVGFRYRLPGVVWVMLYGLAFLAMVMGGYEIGRSGSRRVEVVTLATALAFSVVFALLVAMERPGQYLSTATQEVLIDLQEDIGRSMQGTP
jgi:hypothetical protein